MGPVLLLSALVVPAPLLPAQDNVSIPKARLEELERKERELDRLKGPSKPDSEARPVVGPVAAPLPAPVHASPALTSLPPLIEGQEVEAADLASHYRSEPGLADRRYRGHKFLLRGEIAGFEKPLLRKEYKILLRTADPNTRVVCTFYPPDAYQAVFSAKQGSQLIALAGESRIALAHVGERVVLRAEGRGWKEPAVLISGAALASAPAKPN